MKKAYKTNTGVYFAICDSIFIQIYPSNINVSHIDELKDIINLYYYTECDISEAVAAFDKVVKSLKDKMI